MKKEGKVEQNVLAIDKENYDEFCALIKKEGYYITESYLNKEGKYVITILKDTIEKNLLEMEEQQIKYDNLKKELQQIYDGIKFKPKYEYIIVIPSYKYSILQESIDKSSNKRGHEIYGVTVLQDEALELLGEEYRVYKRKTKIK